MTLSWTERGGGPALVLLHGFTGSSRAWPEACVEALAARFRVLLVDLPGHGESPPPDLEVGFEGTVQAVLAVQRAAEAPRADWVGYSMGARIALAAAVRAPDRVRRLVLESGSPGLETAAERYRRVDEDEALARRIEQEGIPAFVEHWRALPLFATQRRLDPAIQDQERKRRLGNRAEGLAASLRTAGTGAQPSLWRDLPGLEIPTLLLSGGADAKFTRLAGRMAQLLPDATRRVVPGAGHAVHLERSQDWSRALMEHLG